MLKEDVPIRTLWTVRFGRVYEPVVREGLRNECCIYISLLKLLLSLFLIILFLTYCSCL
jgi:hypothetical protein